MGGGGGGGKRVIDNHEHMTHERHVHCTNCRSPWRVVKPKPESDLECVKAGSLLCDGKERWSFFLVTSSAGGGGGGESHGVTGKENTYQE